MNIPFASSLPSIIETLYIPDFFSLGILCYNWYYLLRIFAVADAVAATSAELFAQNSGGRYLKDKSKFIEWTRFKTNHACGFKQGDFGFRFNKYITYCPHDVAAHVAYSRKVAEKSGLIVPQPFPMFTEPTLRLYLSLLHDTMKIDKIDKNHTKIRPLTFAEINPILMDAWLNYGNKATFFVRSMTKTYKTGPPIGERKRMKDYNWENSSPGMSFEIY